MRYLLLFLISFAAYAGDRYYTLPYIAIDCCPEPVQATEPVSKEISKAVALSLASNHPFDFATKQWQASVNGGYYDGQNALSMGLAKRFEGMDALWHTSYGQNSGKHGVTLGAVFRF